MKKILSLLLCAMIVMSFGACGKKEEPKDTNNVMQGEEMPAGDKADKKDSAESKMESKNAGEENSSGAQTLPSKTAEELESMVDEFNTTEDPARKEELRKELEEFLNQAEAMAQ